MIPKTKKLFISYRSNDAAKVDKIANDLALLRYDDGTPRYIPWQDKYNLPPASPNWWDAIVDAIIDCDLFVFHLSRESLQSAVCLAELDYAHKRNRPIIPVVLGGELLLNPKSGKYDILYWDLVPDWLRDVQLLFYVGADFYTRFQQAVTMFERNWPHEVFARRPMNPDSSSVYISNHALYDAACDYAERLAFIEAEKHFHMLLHRNDPDYAHVAAQWLEIISLYAELIEISQRRNARFMFNKKWMAYQALFPKEFLESVFDPQNFGGRDDVTNTRIEASPDTLAEMRQRQKLVVETPIPLTAETSSPPTQNLVDDKQAQLGGVTALIPKSFDSTGIPAGNEKVSIKGSGTETDSFDARHVIGTSKLTTLEEIRSQIVGLLALPATSLISILQAVNNQVINVLHAYEDKDDTT